MTGRFDAELQSFVATQIGETATGDQIELRFGSRRVWQPVLRVNECEDGFQAVGRSARAEMFLLLLNRLTELLLDVHAVRPFQEEPSPTLQCTGDQRRHECVRDRRSIATLYSPDCQMSQDSERSLSRG